MEKVQANFHAEKKQDRIRKTKIKQDKIIDDMRCELIFLALSMCSEIELAVVLLNSEQPRCICGDSGDVPAFDFCCGPYESLWHSEYSHI